MREFWVIDGQADSPYEWHAFLAMGLLFVLVALCLWFGQLVVALCLVTVAALIRPMLAAFSPVDWVGFRFRHDSVQICRRRQGRSAMPKLTDQEWGPLVSFAQCRLTLVDRTLHWQEAEPHSLLLPIHQLSGLMMWCDQVGCRLPSTHD